MIEQLPDDPQMDPEYLERREKRRKFEEEKGDHDYDVWKDEQCEDELDNEA